MRSLPLPLLLALTACSGLITDPGVAPGAGGEGPPRQRPGGGISTCDLEVPPGALAHLTRAQYDNTVRDLLGHDGQPARSFPADDNTEGFDVGLSVPPVLAEAYFETAEALAEEAVADLGSLLPCDPSESGDDACAAEFIAEFAPRAFRRPLSADEELQLVALFERGRDAFDFQTGIQLVVHGVLSSSSFIYHVELQPEASPGSVARVTGYMMANRLSYFLWNSMPDEELFAAAAAGELDTPEGVAAQAARMVEDARIAEGLGNFTRQWLLLDEIEGLDKDPALYPEFDAELADDLHHALDAFMAHVVFEGDGSVESLLTSDIAFVNARTASVYGLDPADFGDELEAVTIESGERYGLLTQPALLAILAKTNQSDPIHRGKFVRERLLCHNLPSPPDDLVIRAPDPAPGLSTRERFAEHSSNPGCEDCHRLMDPIGFGFESYDALGRFRTEDDGRPVDDSGELLATEDADGPFEGVAELSDKLAASDQVRSCIARQVYRYALRRVETTSEACALGELYGAADATGWSIPDMLVQVTATDGFQFRRVQEGN